MAKGLCCDKAVYISSIWNKWNSMIFSHDSLTTTQDTSSQLSKARMLGAMSVIYKHLK